MNGWLDQTSSYIGVQIYLASATRSCVKSSLRDDSYLGLLMKILKLTLSFIIRVFQTVSKAKIFMNLRWCLGVPGVWQEAHAFDIKINQRESVKYFILWLYASTDHVTMVHPSNATVLNKVCRSKYVYICGLMINLKH